MSNRRVVTGLDAEGRSCFLIDEPIERVPSGLHFVWRSETVPADNSGTADTGGGAFPLEYLRRPGSNFVLAEMKPGGEPFMHATDTLDYVVIIRGEIMFTLETGEVLLRAGDLAVDRGAIHGWRAVGTETALMAVVSIPADPLGGGATI
jgi:quercetin dioxygenase-like cupin family protein